MRSSTLQTAPPARFAGDCQTWMRLLFVLLPVVLRSMGSASEALSFERDIRPILKANCFQCHGEGESLKGGVDLRLRRFMLTNSESGPVLLPGDPAKSVIWQSVSSGKMPKGDRKLSPEAAEKIRRWISLGAPTLRPEPESVPKFFITEEERSFWSFQPVRRPTPPQVPGETQPLAPIDAFLLHKLQERGLGFAAPADKISLIRRVTFDLNGLPPTPEEVTSFLQDNSPEAYHKVVERLLASPRYGEKWARHWLDVAGYADSNGGVEADSERGWAWRYRDYVIRSLNADKPWDKFITEQVAGDELVAPPYEELEGEALDKLIATGFLRLAPDPTGDGPPEPELARNQVLADTLQIVSTSLLGLTVHCAQCHDHRYDPIPQADYYRLRAIFEPALDWKHWKNPGEREISLMGKTAREEASCIEHASAQIDRDANQLHDQLIEQFVQKQLELVPPELREPVLAARRTPADKRTEEHKRLLREFPTFQDHIILGEVNVEGAKRVEEVRKRATALRGLKPVDPRVHCLIEEPAREVTTCVFHRGDPLQPREKVLPSDLTIVQPEGASGAVLGGQPTARGTSGRRLDYARHLTDGSHPLVARVIVNRVWHHLFGAGIVTTLADFGMLGERPTHPELLDWLASEFVAQGWKLKSLHRLMVHSAAYRQGTRNAAAQTADPDNRLLGRMKLRRLDSEQLRDALLVLSGHLNTNMYGAGVPVTVTPQGQFVVGVLNKDQTGDWTSTASADLPEFRRSIYVQVRRSMPVGMMETFDTAKLTPNCEIRAISTIPAQSLMFLNDQFVLERSRDLADRLRKECSGNSRDQIRRLWMLLFGIPPTDAELSRSLVFLAEQTETIRAELVARSGEKSDSKSKSGPAAQADPSLLSLASLCQSLWASNRFLYLD